MILVVENCNIFIQTPDSQKAGNESPSQELLPLLG